MPIIPYKAFYVLSSPSGVGTRTLFVRVGCDPDFNHQARTGTGGMPYPRDRILGNSIAPGPYYITSVPDRLTNVYPLIAY